MAPTQKWTETESPLRFRQRRSRWPRVAALRGGQTDSGVELWIKSTSPKEDWPADDGLANHFSLLIFSERLRIALDDACIGGIQYLPIRVLKSDDTEYTGYSIANIMNEISTLDRDRSSSSVFSQNCLSGETGSRFWDARQAGLKEEALRVFDIIRVSDFPEAVYVSQRFEDIWRDHKLTGYSFQKVRLNP